MILHESGSALRLRLPPGVADQADYWYHRELVHCIFDYYMCCGETSGQKKLQESRIKMDHC